MISLRDSSARRSARVAAILCVIKRIQMSRSWRIIRRCAKSMQASDACTLVTKKNCSMPKNVLPRSGTHFLIKAKILR